MIASEELEPGTGWAYNGWLPKLADDPGISIEKLGKYIVDSFVNGVQQYSRSEYATLSVIDLSEMDQLQAAVEDMAATLSKQLQNDFSTISRLRQNMRSFGEISNAASDMVDMTTYAEVFSRYDADAAAAIKAALKDESLAIHREDIAQNKAISEYGLSLLKPGNGLLTHCNAGPIATSEYGTALGPILLGLLQPVLYFLCESYGISLTNSTFAGVIIATGPLAGLVAGIFTLGEIPKKSQVWFSLVSIIGVIMMTLQQRSEGEVKMLGVLLLIGAVCCGTSFSVISRKLSKEFSALERTYVMMGVAAVSFTCMALVQCRGNMALLAAPLQNAGFIWAILYLGFASSIVAFMALNVASGYLPVAKTMAFCNLTTVISLFAGVIFLKEPFNAVSLLASVLIILGIWGVQRVKN
jgi:drug/metabolite transporter (DMT)-like permease